MRMPKKNKLIYALLLTCLFLVFLATGNVFSEAPNESVIEKAHRLQRLIHEKAAKGQDVSMALDLDKKSQLAAQEGNIDLVNKLLSDAIKILEDNVSSETTKESTVEVNKAPSETTNKPLIEKVERLKKLIQEKAAKGQDISMALYLDRKSQLAAKEGDFNLADKLLSDAIKTLEDLTKKFPAKKVIELPVKADKVIVTDGVPKYQTGQEVKEYKDAFNTKTILANDGKIRLEITSTPIYIEEESSTTKLKIHEESPFGAHPGYTYKKANIDRKELKWVGAGSTRPQKLGFDYSNSLDIGVKWNRPEIYAVWDIIQKTDKDIEKNIYDWEITDYIYGNVPKGINIVANIDVTENRMVRGEMPFPKTFRFKTKYLEEKYIAFVKKLVERYDGDGIEDMPKLANPVKHWQVFNEPDFTPKAWEEYAHLVEITYKAVKDACQECNVLIGGMAVLPEFHNFYIPILKKFKGKYIDIFDFHHFGEAWEWLEYVDIVDIIKKGLSENGYDNIEIWTTETGTHSGKPVNLREQTEREQAEGLIKRYVYAMSVGVKKIFWAFGITEGFADRNIDFDYTGLIYDGKGSGDLGCGKKKLSYYTYRMMTEKLEGSNYSKIECLELGERIYAYRFSKQGKFIYVLWYH